MDEALVVRQPFFRLVTLNNVLSSVGRDAPTGKTISPKQLLRGSKRQCR